jgi:citronellol/citronellal dehydrogenase
MVSQSDITSDGTLRDKTIVISGASRGIGRAIALRAAQDGANVVILGKTSRPHRVLAGTILETAREVAARGGQALAVQTDVRSEEQVADALAQCVAKFGGLDILVNNASAISLAGTQDVNMRRFDLMHEVNTRGTFLCTKLALPHLSRSANPHVLNLAPPAEIHADWFASHPAYTLAKFGMSLCTLAHAQEFRNSGIAVNALWPLTTIATAAVSNVIEKKGATRSRTPEIMADAAWLIVTSPALKVTGQFFIDEEVLRAHGVQDLSKYDVGPPGPRTMDLFVPSEVVARSVTPLERWQGEG